MSILFSIDQVKVLHLEPTTVCNAACPQCVRTYLPFTPAELHLEQIKEIFSSQFIKQLDKMFMCGNLGDPAAARDSIEIYRYFRSHNPNITLGMNTNGSIRTKEWWYELGLLFNQPKDYVVFSIDGLEDTNHIYRVNTIWSNIMNNAKSYIAAGGKAFWDMLVFEHNEHQVSDALALANTMGFKRFSVKISNRHQRVPIKFLRPPIGFNDPVIKGGVISCKALNEASIYVDAQGRWYPCCWQGLEEPYDLTQRFTNYINSWSSSVPNSKCQTTCSVIEGKNSFTDQWVKTITLKP